MSAKKCKQWALVEPPGSLKFIFRCFVTNEMIRTIENKLKTLLNIRPDYKYGPRNVRFRCISMNVFTALVYNDTDMRSPALTRERREKKMFPLARLDLLRSMSVSRFFLPAPILLHASFPTLNIPHSPCLPTPLRSPLSGRAPFSTSACLLRYTPPSLVTRDLILRLQHN